MLRKPGNYACKNGLAIAVSELEPIKHTSFILNWRQSHVQKLEAIKPIQRSPEP